MNEAIEAYPLQWPPGWPRTKYQDRKSGKFSKQGRSDYGNWRQNKPVTLAQATRRVLEEVERLDGPGRSWSRIDPDNTIISSDLKVRVSDGLPKSGQRKPEDPGVAVYFKLDGKSQCIPCDAYSSIEQNLAAVAATLSALRTLDRHGSGIMERAFTGFEALPHLAQEPWYVVLNLMEDAPWPVVEKQAKKLRSAYHPDHGGDANQFDRIIKAFDEAKRKRAA